jgi:putative tricarboxylic transport membrane protein
LLQSQPHLVWGLIASLFIGNVMLLVLNLPLIAIWVKLLHIPAPLLYAGILVFATIGTYGITQSPVDLILLYLIGGIGYLMRRYDFPAAPVIIGMILGPLAEQNFRQAMTISAGDWTVFFTRPLSATILALAALALFGPKLYQLAMRPKPDHVATRECTNRLFRTSPRFCLIGTRQRGITFSRRLHNAACERRIR